MKNRKIINLSVVIALVVTLLFANGAYAAFSEKPEAPELTLYEYYADLDEPIQAVVAGAPDSAFWFLGSYYGSGESAVEIWARYGAADWEFFETIDLWDYADDYYSGGYNAVLSSFLPEEATQATSLRARVLHTHVDADGKDIVEYSDWSNTLQIAASAQSGQSGQPAQPTQPTNPTQTTQPEQAATQGKAISWLNSSDWAYYELMQADAYGIIPETLYGKDFTLPISRAEFAAVAVKAYEYLTGDTFTVTTNPFTDTSDPYVKKAYDLGIVAGTSAATFDPNALLNREQAAAMLTRVLKSVYIPGWILPADGAYSLVYTQPARFADDGRIGEWAKQSVYFMNANDIILGTGDNMFSPGDGAAREQALAIAVRMIMKFESAPIKYTGG